MACDEDCWLFPPLACPTKEVVDEDWPLDELLELELELELDIIDELEDDVLAHWLDVVICCATVESDCIVEGVADVVVPQLT